MPYYHPHPSLKVTKVSVDGITTYTSWDEKERKINGVIDTWEKLLKKYSPLEKKIEIMRQDLNIRWTDILIEYPMPEDLLVKLMPVVSNTPLNQKILSSSQVLSEKFIRNHSAFLDWARISYHQKLSENFIREFAEKVDWEAIFSHQKISDEFRAEMQLKGYM